MYKSKYHKKGFGSKKRKKTLMKDVNPGYRASRDNMVWMKRLHRGKSFMKYNYGNPTSSNTGYLRGKQIDNVSHIPKHYKHDKKVKMIRYRRSEF